MKCLIICPASDVRWVREYFDGCPPYLLPLANKPFLEYLLDYCMLSKVSAVRIVSDLPLDPLKETLGDGQRWNFQLACASADCSLPPEELVTRNYNALGNDDLLIFRGMFFLHYDTREFVAPESAPDEIKNWNDHMILVGRNCNCGLCDFSAARRFADPGVLEELNSIQRFYERSMQLVRGGAEYYSMPSYSNSPNIYIGQNVAIGRTTRVEEPVHLGSIVQLSEHSTIGPSAVIGDNTFIDEDTVIRDSVIMYGSYVGRQLEIIGKIVWRSIVINPQTGAKLDIVDDFLLTRVEAGALPKAHFFQRLSALALWLWMLLPFCLLRPWIRIQSEMVNCYLSRDLSRLIRLRLYLRPGTRFAIAWFRKLSLDRFHLLPLVISGKLRLVGNRLMPVSERSQRFLEQFPDYAPGLFSYSEMLEHENDPFQCEMDELYYVYHATFGFNLVIIYKTLMRNLLKDTRHHNQGA